MKFEHSNVTCTLVSVDYPISSEVFLAYHATDGPLMSTFRTTFGGPGVARCCCSTVSTRRSACVYIKSSTWRVVRSSSSHLLNSNHPTKSLPRGGCGPAINLLVEDVGGNPPEETYLIQTLEVKGPIFLFGEALPNLSLLALQHSTATQVHQTCYRPV